MRKILQEQFTKKGVKYTQLEKNDSFVLYQCESNGYTYYELFKYKVSPYPVQWESTMYIVEAMKKKHFS